LVELVILVVLVWRVPLLLSRVSLVPSVVATAAVAAATAVLVPAAVQVFRAVRNPGLLILTRHNRRPTPPLSPRIIPPLVLFVSVFLFLRRALLLKLPLRLVPNLFVQVFLVLNRFPLFLRGFALIHAVPPVPAWRSGARSLALRTLAVVHHA